MKVTVLLIALWCVTSRCQKLSTKSPPVEYTGHYVITSPRILRPASSFTLSVTVIEAPTPVNVTATLSTTDNSNVLHTANLEITAGHTEEIKLQVPVVLAEHSYTLHVMGMGGLSFDHVVSVDVKRKSMTLLVATDKATYKPGNKVLFRALAVLPDLKPYQGLLNISIQDPNDNRIAQWLEQDTTHGVFTSSLLLSTQPPLGAWTIHIESHGQTYEQQFEVAEYVLPTFEVTLQGASFYVVPDVEAEHTALDDLTFHVSSLYTYKKNVKGQASITFQVKPYGEHDTGHYRALTRIAQLEGAAGEALTWTIPYGDIMSIAPPPSYDYTRSEMIWRPWYTLHGRQLLVNASVTEALTGRIQSANLTLSIVRQKYQTKILDITPGNYKPGLSFPVFVQLSQMDGLNPHPRDIVDPDGMSKTCTLRVIEQSVDYTQDATDKLMVISPSGFMATTVHAKPSTKTIYIQVTSCLDAAVQPQKTIEKFASLSNEGIQISLRNSKGIVKAGHSLEFELNSTTSINQFSYQVLAKGDIAMSRTLTLPSATRSHRFDLAVSTQLAQHLAPSARIIVWHVTSTAEVVADTLDLQVEGAFNNNVTLSFSDHTVRPGTNTSLRVTAAPQSYVAVMAVDQSVLLLGNGNHITQAKVLSDLESYDSTTFTESRPWPVFRCFECGWWPVSTGGQDSHTLLENAGLNIFTDALVYQKPRGDCPYCRFDFIDDDMEMAAAEGPLPDGAQRDSDGPVMDSAPDNSSPTKTPVSRIRKEFPETWIWADDVVSEDGEVTWVHQVPDTITSWVASAFAMNSQVGLGVSTRSAELTVFKPFFVKLNLPYSVIQTEQTRLMATIFNYLPTEQQILVTLEKSEHFGVVSSLVDLDAVEHVAQIQNVTIAANDVGQVYFIIVPNSLGHIPITVRAQSADAGDALRRELLVEPQGTPQSQTRAFMVRLSEPGEWSEQVHMTYPPDLVPGSARLTVTATADMMSSTINGLDQLLRMPFGCGEQNMLNFAPNIYIMDYLRATSQSSPDITDKAVSYMETGYQRELTYQHFDGSFSAFGNSDPSGSTWLTSFVLLSFHRSMAYISVGPVEIARGLAWIMRQQTETGVFLEPGRVIHREMQGGAAQGLAMTAYSLLALLENNDPIIKQELERTERSLEQTIALTTSYLETKLDDASVASKKYEMCVISYALTLSGSHRAEDALDTVLRLATNTGGLLYWEPEPMTPDSGDYAYYYRPQTTNIEATAYGLLTFTRQDRLVDALKIAKWLVSQQNARGGFSSTQDTVVALQALAEFAAVTSRREQHMDVFVTTLTESVVENEVVSTDLVQEAGGRTEILRFSTLTPRNALVLQSLEVSSSVRQLALRVNGSGLAVVQVSADFHTFSPYSDKQMVLHVTSDNTHNDVKVHVCSSWLGSDQSGMVVTEVSFLSGYSATNVDQLLSDVDDLARIDVEAQKVVFYFNEITEVSRCFDLETVQVEPVGMLSKAQVKTYPYYHPEKALVDFYIPRALESRTVCDTCPVCCGGAPYTTLNPVGPTDSAPHPLALSFTLLSLMTSMAVVSVQ